MGDITIFGQNSLNLNFQHCVNKILNRQFKEILIVIVRRKVEPKSVVQPIFTALRQRNLKTSARRFQV